MILVVQIRLQQFFLLLSNFIPMQIFVDYIQKGRISRLKSYEFFDGYCLIVLQRDYEYLHSCVRVYFSTDLGQDFTKGFTFCHSNM